MNNQKSTPLPMGWIMMTVAAGLLVLMAALTTRSMVNALHKADTSIIPTVIPEATPVESATPVPNMSATSQPPKSRATHFDFEQIRRDEQEQKRSYQLLREQAKAHPGELGTLTEEEISKMEKEGITGDNTYP